MARTSQRARLAGHAGLGVGDRPEIRHARKPDDPPRELRTRETERVARAVRRHRRERRVGGVPSQASAIASPHRSVRHSAAKRAAKASQNRTPCASTQSRRSSRPAPSGRALRATATGRATLVLRTDPDEALEVADRVVVLSHGPVAGEHRVDAAGRTAIVREMSAAVAACLALGGALGLVAGALIVRLRIPHLPATLGMMVLLLGLLLIPAAGRSIAIGMSPPDSAEGTGRLNAAFLAPGRHRVWDAVPVSVLAMLALAVFLAVTRRGA